MRPVPISGMDVVRERRAGIPRSLAGAIVVALFIGGAVVAVTSLARMRSDGVVVDRSAIVSDIARRGTLQRSIAASGTFASQNVRIVAATQAGIVETVSVKPGTSVTDGTPIAQMSNPDLQAAVTSAASAVGVAEAELQSTVQQARASALVQQSAVTVARAQAQEDATNRQSLESLYHSGFVAEQTYRIAAIKETASSSQLGVAKSQVGVDFAEQRAKIAATQAQLQQAQAALTAKQSELAALVVRARSAGVVQSVAVDPGARVDAGAELARVADQSDLKAVLAVPEGQAHSVMLGMPVSIDTGNGVAVGHVERIAPSAQNGSVAVDVSFSNRLPPGTRPDSNVDGTIELETLRNVVSIARPAGAADDTTISLYRIDAATSLAHLVQVHLGRGSADRVQVLSGIAPGDTVIVSDTSAYGSAPALRLR